MDSKKLQLTTRRGFLRGLGTAMALPMLESVAPGTRSVATLLGAETAGAASVPPLRMAFLFVPNGVHPTLWTPEGEGTRFDLTYPLEPLRHLRDDVLVLSGLTHDKGRANGDGAGDHARSASVFLTGAQPVKTPGAGIRSGVSVDQIAAKAVGHKTRFPSLELAVDGGGNSGNCDSGYSCAYSNNISWAGASMPMAKEIDPRRVFDRLFADSRPDDIAENRARRIRQRKSILDFVLEDARRLRSFVSVNDRRKVDEYFNSVREIERRLERAGLDRPLDEITEPEGLPEKDGSRVSFEEHVALMGELMALAFRTDTTRIATFMYARAGSNRNYRHIDVPDGHHDLSHHQGNPEKLRKIREINRHHVGLFARLLERLRSIPEGDGTLLDNCMIVYGSGLCDGNRHNNENLPVLLAGRGGGTIDTGRHVRYAEETPMCNLFLSLLDRMGAPTESMGDSTGALGRLVL